MVPSLLGVHVQDQVTHAVAVAKLVVVPAARREKRHLVYTGNRK